ncbi:hypothetical protein VT84_10985 [Gemmata sp. SH-PL17]|uniref:hypothetical protein n=1 Tax=Gemmata sp. SH-PL17 TaxID=1630693 RepID=UPI00078E9435|nr:hypothetical protein [Gemmata sp. SH-PL17]AMV24914.1 hypothetical protein VT84_10985 [Gemmata sp. SH-PL17]
MNGDQHNPRLQWAVFVVLAVIDAGLLVKLFVGSSDIVGLLIGIGIVSALLVVTVRIFDLGSLSVGKEGMKAELREVKDEVGVIQNRQDEQERYLDAFFRILSERLTLPMKYHLRALARGGEMYKGQDSLRQDLLQLKRFGLIEEVSPQKIGDFLDGKDANVASFVRLTQTGEKFLLALDKIEAQ